MIDGIGRSGAGRVDLLRGEAKQGAGPAAPAGNPAAQSRSEGLGGLASAMAALGPPVDEGKVSAIRQAIAEGRYTVDAGAIAERMIAVDLGR